MKTTLTIAFISALASSFAQASAASHAKTVSYDCRNGKAVGYTLETGPGTVRLENGTGSASDLRAAGFVSATSKSAIYTGNIVLNGMNVVSHVRVQIDIALLEGEPKGSFIIYLSGADKNGRKFTCTPEPAKNFDLDGTRLRDMSLGGNAI